jgi:hypothetical protein
MPDISMCWGENCPLKNDCYRFTAKASQWQYYFTSIPFDHEKHECEFYMEDTKE